MDTVPSNGMVPFKSLVIKSVPIQFDPGWLATPKFGMFEGWCYNLRPGSCRTSTFTPASARDVQIQLIFGLAKGRLLKRHLRSNYRFLVMFNSTVPVLGWFQLYKGWRIYKSFANFLAHSSGMIDLKCLSSQSTSKQISLLLSFRTFTSKIASFN